MLPDEPWARFSKAGSRAEEEEVGGEPAVPDGRSEARRDHDRVFYSAEFERLEDVTQIATLTSSTVRNRLTHSYRVEQIARSIAATQHLPAGTSLDEYVDVVMTAALVHDMGHAPFGHTGEEALQRLVTCDEHRLRTHRDFEGRIADAKLLDKGMALKKPCSGGECELLDGFEGNAQSFRILTLLASNHPGTPNNGLDLTRAVLQASLKYPWFHGAKGRKPSKWGIYDCDIATAQWLFGDASDQRNPTAEASIMDIADDIAYAVHDLEDAYKAGLIQFADIRISPASKTFLRILDYIAAESKSEDAEVSALGASDVQRVVTQFEDLKSGAIDDITKSPVLSTLQTMLAQIGEVSFGSDLVGRQQLSRWRAALIAEFVGGVVVNSKAHFQSDDLSAVNEFLKQLTWYFVIDNSELTAIRQGQERLIEVAFTTLFSRAREAYLSIPDERNSDLRDAPLHRLRKRLPERLADYIDLAIAQYERDNLAERTYYRPRSVLARAVVDYICSLTDSQVYAYSSQVSGAPTHAAPSAFM